MASINKNGGVNIDLELKTFFAVASYTVLKFISSFSPTISVTLARLFFFVGNALLAVCFLKTRNSVAQLTNISHDSKSSALSEGKSLFWSIMGRAVVVFFIHARTGMQPPLLISVLMGLFSIMENPYCLDTLISSYPKIFGKLNDL